MITPNCGGTRALAALPQEALMLAPSGGRQRFSRDSPQSHITEPRQLGHQGAPRRVQVGQDRGQGAPETLKDDLLQGLPGQCRDIGEPPVNVLWQLKIDGLCRHC